MHEDVLRSLAVRASSDRAFLSGLRREPEATLAAHGYALTQEELATVMDLRRRTAALGDAATRPRGRGAGAACLACLRFRPRPAPR
jgi:hypothetical protein